MKFHKHTNTFGGLLLFGRGTARWVARAVLPRVTVLVFIKAFNTWVNHRSQAEAKTSHCWTFNRWVNHRSFASLGEDLPLLDVRMVGEPQVKTSHRRMKTIVFQKGPLA